MKEIVLTEEPHPQSRGMLVLLCRALLRKVAFRGYQGWLRFRLELLERWQSERGELRCHYCSKGPLMIEVDNKHPMVATLDHVIPRSKGGANMNESNLVVACYRCNQKKKDKILGEETFDSSETACRPSV